MARRDPKRPTPAYLECDALLPPSHLTRRAVFSVAAGLVAAGCSSKAAKWNTKPVESEGDLVELDLKDYPELATAGGMVAVKPSGGKDPILVMRIENNMFRVMSLRCPHLGCVVRWDNELQLLACPCHGSKFSDQGQKLEGPANRGLDLLPVQAVGTKVQFKLQAK
jgi:Rieske Fe-S protein